MPKFIYRYIGAFFRDDNEVLATAVCVCFRYVRGGALEPEMCIAYSGILIEINILYEITDFDFVFCFNYLNLSQQMTFNILALSTGVVLKITLGTFQFLAFCFVENIHIYNCFLNIKLLRSDITNKFLKCSK